jgi:hypothetical protein
MLMFSLDVADLDGGLSRIMAVFRENVDGHARAVERGEGVGRIGAEGVIRHSPTGADHALMSFVKCIEQA